MGAEQFLGGMLASYYRENQAGIVPDIASREFGIGSFGQKISSRHLSFRSSQELNSFLREKAPFYISYSCARYVLPSARPMEKKNMLGADLVYEFDADEIKTDCKGSHDSWKCTSCTAQGKGNIRECMECGSGTKVDEWVCPECIGEARRQTIKLIETIEGDFGFSQGLAVNFSGSKGFHIHVRGKDVQALSKPARLELLDYITGANLDLEALGFSFPEKGACSCPKRVFASGWPEKIFGKIEQALDSGDASALAVMGSLTSMSAAQKTLNEKPSILGAMDRGLLLPVKGINGGRFWKSMVSSAIDMEKFYVDRQTSVDINKIVRVPGTIHGSTGMTAKVVEKSSLAAFDALSESVVLPGHEVKLLNACSPRFHIAKKWFGPFKNESVSLPAFAAFYLLARGSATLGD